MKFINFLVSLFLVFSHQICAQKTNTEKTDVSFKKLTLLNKYISEGASIGDMDGDGNQDIVAGVLWWKGPDFKEAFSYSPVKTFPITGMGSSGYSTNFFTFPDDIDGDKWLDILQIGFVGTGSHWFQNPGKTPFSDTNIDKEVNKYKAQVDVCNELPQLLDIIGDSKKELLAYSKGSITLGIPDASGKAWQTLAISHHDENRFSLYIHGLGAGDINMDGRKDILEKNGWWEQPINWDLKSMWKYHPYDFSPDMGGAQMYAFDINGDGLNDVITSMNAHAYGLSWHEQINIDGEIGFIEHIILPAKATKNSLGINFSQLHALAIADFDNDGINDIVTGKCYYAHNGNDPGAEEPAVLYWFKTSRNKDGSVKMIPYLIDRDTGAGRQISTGDLNKDGKMDLVVSNKKGVFAFIQK